MRLSDAIRLGSMLHPQGFGKLAVLDLHGQILATCALGAAVQAGYVRGSLLVAVASCPVCDGVAQGRQLITHLNDAHHWTREAIADWVESLESAQAADVVVKEDGHALV